MSPARKGSAKKRAAGRATKRVRKRGATKRAAKRAPKRLAKKRKAPARRRPAKRTATTRSTSKRPAAARSRTTPKAARRAPAPKPAPAFPQTATASGKQRVLFELVRARASFLAAVQGLPSGAAERPMAGGGWSARDMVLHLVVRDRVRLREMEAALRGRPASWFGIAPAEQDRANAEDLLALGPHGWDDALRLLHSTREQLLEALESIPEEPAEVWDPGHPLGWMLSGLPRHDRHHADHIKRWRAGAGASKGRG